MRGIRCGRGRSSVGSRPRRAKQAQTDCTDFVDAPGVTRDVWRFSMALGYGRWHRGRFVASQNLRSVLRSHIAAMGGAPEDTLHEGMATAVIGEDEAGIIAYEPPPIVRLNHRGAKPRTRGPSAHMTGKVERPFSFMQQDFFPGRGCRNLEDRRARWAIHAFTPCPASWSMGPSPGSCPTTPCSPLSAGQAKTVWCRWGHSLLRCGHHPTLDARSPVSRHRTAHLWRRALYCPPYGAGRQGSATGRSQAPLPRRSCRPHRKDCDCCWTSKVPSVAGRRQRGAGHVRSA